MNRSDVAKIIDHTIVRANATVFDVEKYCREAKEYGFRAVGVASCYVKLAKHLLEGSKVKVCAGVSFPFGSASTDAKVLEAKRCVEEGADDIDMVMNIGLFKSQRYDEVKRDIESVVAVSRKTGDRIGKDILFKVILEVGYLSDEEIKKASLIVKDAGADVIKTCTGYGPRGPTPHDIRLIREAVGKSVMIKAAQGINTLQKLIELLNSGADFIGSSKSVSIIEELPP